MDEQPRRSLAGHGIPVPTSISPAARLDLEARDRLPPAAVFGAETTEAWLAIRDSFDAVLARKFAPMRERFRGAVQQRNVAGIALYEILPAEIGLPDCAVLDLHGGALRSPPPSPAIGLPGTAAELSLGAPAP